MRKEIKGIGRLLRELIERDMENWNVPDVVKRRYYLGRSFEDMAEIFYSKGYRKESDIIKEFSEKLKVLLKEADDFSVKDSCTRGNLKGLQVAIIIIDDLSKAYDAEVKK